MPRKPKDVEEPELEVDVNEEPPKRETYASKWFKDHAVNNKKELKIVCDLTARSVADQFNFHVKSGNTEVYAVIFYATFLTILEYLKGKQKLYSNYTIQIGNSLNIGYTNNDDDENEKVGSFTPLMEYINVNRSIISEEPLYETGNTDATNFIRWKQLNSKKELDAMREIQNLAYEKLQSEFRISLRTEESVIPMFCIFIDNLAAVAKQSYNELKETGISEVSINVFGLFDIYYSYSEDLEKELWEYQPSVSMKLFLKSDELAFRDN